MMFQMHETRRASSLFGSVSPHSTDSYEVQRVDETRRGSNPTTAARPRQDRISRQAKFRKSSPIAMLLGGGVTVSCHPNGRRSGLSSFGVGIPERVCNRVGRSRGVTRRALAEGEGDPELATYHAIAAIGQAVLGMLEQARIGSEFDGFDFELYQASNFHSPMDEGLSLFLYNTVVSTARRNVPGRVLPNGTTLRPPLPLDLYYLLTPWAKTAVTQHRLLGWAMRALDDTPTLPASLLNHYGPEPDTFWPDETVTFVSEPISLQDIYNIWEINKQNMQLSVAYVARVVLIDSAVPSVTGAPVQTRSPEYVKGRRQP
jgi:hypothetical protein